MTTQSQKLSSNIKKSLLCITALSMLTGGLVLLENYRTAREAQQFSEHLKQYSQPVTTKSQTDQAEVFFQKHRDNSLLTTDANELAKIAEKNLIKKPENDLKSASINNVNQAVSKTRIQQQDPSPEKASEIDPNEMNILFTLSSSQIRPEYKLQLLDIADYINGQGKQAKWQVVGHTDKSGRASYNLALAKKRADNVVNFLVEHGVQRDQLTLFTLGEYQAMHLANSTYNASLRRVQVMPYESSIEKLAKMIRKDNHQAEKQQLAKQSDTQLDSQKNVIEKEFRHINETLQEDNSTVQINTDLTLDDINKLEQEVHINKSLSDQFSNSALLVDDESHVFESNNSSLSSKASTLSINESESLAYASGYSL
ncbi:hypothetical protein DS885_05180 [Psychromonas sp. B3M02]|uniref:OmpA family protein n=1 Tax=Psychromonas sp. B3M02 TaxID=2267226 RepID=UPI000DEB2FDF|nr:OmpA family protein [Psychromonas sp. B3M02]RBW47032.1 hypothetical protein DS885_05180 [Psychromonas sp. B3M02]